MDLSYLGQFDFIYGYVRVSSQTQYDRQTIEVQLNRVQGITPAPTAIYQDVQGGDESERPKYQELIAQCRQDALNGYRVLVVVTEQSRLSREGADAVTKLIELFDALKITLYALDEGLLTVADPSQWLAIGNKALFHAYFLREHRRRLRAGREQRRQEGKPVQPNCPLGYSWTREKYVLNDQARIARELFDHYLPKPVGDGWSLRKCCQWLEEQGFRYSPQGVRNLLVNPIYRGILSYSEGGLSREEQKRGVFQKRKVMIYDAHEALISFEEYELIQRQLEENKVYARAGNVKRYPLSGLIHCGFCSGKMTITSTTDRRYGKTYWSYECRNRDCQKHCVSYRVIEKAVIDALVSRAKAIAEIASEDEPESIPHELQELRNQLRQLEQIPGSNRAISQAIETTQAQIARMEKELQGREKEVGKNKKMLATFEEAASAVEYWEGLGEEDKRFLYHSLIKKVVVHSVKQPESRLFDRRFEVDFLF